MFILKKGHQPGVYVPLRALFLVYTCICYVFQALNNVAPSTTITDVIFQ